MYLFLRCEFCIVLLCAGFANVRGCRTAGSCFASALSEYVYASGFVIDSYDLVVERDTTFSLQNSFVMRGWRDGGRGKSRLLGNWGVQNSVGFVRSIQFIDAATQLGSDRCCGHRVVLPQGAAKSKGNLGGNPAPLRGLWPSWRPNRRAFARRYTPGPHCGRMAFLHRLVATRGYPESRFSWRRAARLSQFFRAPVTGEPPVTTSCAAFRIASERARRENGRRNGVSTAKAVVECSGGREPAERMAGSWLKPRSGAGRKAPYGGHVYEPVVSPRV